MTQVPFTEAVSKLLVNARKPNGTVDPIALQTLLAFSDNELTAIKNCYRQMSHGDNLAKQVEQAAKKGHPALEHLSDRLAFLSRKDEEMLSGLRGALHCFTYTLKASETPHGNK